MPDVNPIPEGYPRVTPYLIVDGAASAIDFYTKVLGATERMRMPAPEGRIGHAEIELGDSIIMLADPSQDAGARDPQSVGGSPVLIHAYVEDVDATFAAALDAGATSTREVETQFYGDRSGQFVDPFGHHWSIASHVEDVSPEEMEKRMSDMAAAS